MELSLFGIDNSHRVASNSSNSNSIDIDNNDVLRIDNDRTVEELIKEDRHLVMFLIVLGFYIDDGRNSMPVKIMSRLWQFNLLLFGGIGFVWQVFVGGGQNVKVLHNLLVSSDSTAMEIFIGWGNVLYFFIAPFVQVTSLMYGVYKVYKGMRHQTVKSNIVSKHIASSKRSALIFFIIMALFVIAIDPFFVSREFFIVFNNNNSQADDYTSKIGIRNYSIFAFNGFTTNLFLNLAVTCYLTLMLFLTSLSLKQIKTIQEYVIMMIDTDTFSARNYLLAKDKIIMLKNGSYDSVEWLTFASAINVVSFMYILWYTKYQFMHSNISLQAMVLYIFAQLPFLAKGYS